MAGSFNSNSPGVYYSRDGLNWEIQQLPNVIPSGNSVNSRIIASGEKVAWIVYNESFRATVASSTNGADWDILASPLGDIDYQRIVYGNGRLVIHDYFSLFVSENEGESFGYYPTPFLVGGKILFAGGRFFLDFKLASSIDGITWGPDGVSGVSNIPFSEIAYGNGRYVAIGRATLPDGEPIDQIAVWESTAPPIVTRQPSDRWGGEGRSSTFNMEMAYSPTPLSYQWQQDGQPIEGATSASYTIAKAAPKHAGSYRCEVTNQEGTISSEPAKLEFISANKVSRLVNLSVRGAAGTGSATFVTGFVVGGGSSAQSMPLLVRGVGPTLGEFGVSNYLPDPEINVFNEGADLIANNDNWSGATTLMSEFARLGAFLFNADNSRDAAVRLDDIIAGPHSVHTLSQDEQPGIALSEIYDATQTVDASSPRLINLSCRALAGSGAETLTGGFVLSGETATRVMIRAVGPTLADFGVEGTLSDPRITLRRIENGALTEIDTNDDWAQATRDTQQQVGAFNLAADSKDAVLIAELGPGVYAAEVAGVIDETGIVLLEIYEIPNQ